MIHRTAALLLAGALAVACGGHEGHDHGEHEGHAAHGHTHEAPRGGALVVLGDEFAHVEVLLDPATGELTAWVLGAHAEAAVRLAQPEIRARIGEGEESFEVVLAAVANELTGEKPGDSSEFRGASERLKGLERFKVVLEQLEVKGSRFEAVGFEYPEGNE